MGNIIGRLFYRYTTVVKDRKRSYEVNADILENNNPSKQAPFFEDLRNIGSDVDEVTIAITDYQRIQELLREVTEKQFEKAYQQAVILLSSGNNVKSEKTFGHLKNCCNDS